MWLIKVLLKLAELYFCFCSGIGKLSFKPVINNRSPQNISFEFMADNFSWDIQFTQNIIRVFAILGKCLIDQIIGVVLNYLHLAAQHLASGANLDLIINQHLQYIPIDLCRIF